jgi:hypothetical protein
MKNAVFWDVGPCRSCVNRRFGGTVQALVRRIHIYREENFIPKTTLSYSGGGENMHIHQYLEIDFS